MTTIAERHARLLAAIAESARRHARPTPRLLAVVKAQPMAAVREAADAGQRLFGENYLQQAVKRRAHLAIPGAQWHFIGHLQTNKAADVAQNFNWVQSVDRLKLIHALAKARAPDAAPLNVLLQVNVDGEKGKGGCTPAELPALGRAVAESPNLTLRGLMAIPAPGDVTRLRQAFAQMRTLQKSLAAAHPGIDTLSMGMSDDFDLAIAEGSTMVRIGTALFGRRQ